MMRAPWSALLSRVCAVLVVLGASRGVSAFGGVAHQRSRPCPQGRVASSLSSRHHDRGILSRSYNELDKHPKEDVTLHAALGGGGGGGDIDDPNPGGLRDYGGNDDGDSGGDDTPFLEKVRLWLGSNEGLQDVQTYCISFLIALALRVLIVEPRFIPSLSMYPTFDVGDQLAVEKVSKRMRPMSKKEVIVFRPPQTFRDIMSASYGIQSKKSKEALIKRIVAVEGEEVRVKGGKLYVNGEEQEEPYVNNGRTDYVYGPVVVPPGNVFVLGDNRNESMDGHIWGFLPKENVIGRAVFTYWPPWRIGSDGLY